MPVVGYVAPVTLVHGPDEVTPVIPVDGIDEVMPVVPVEVGDVGSTEDVEVGAEGLRVRAVGGGLTPPAPSSVAPAGMPSRPTGVVMLMPVGDEADAAGCARAVLPTAPQVPEAFPTRPPPSKTVVEPDVDEVELPMPEDIPDIELPPPEDVPVIELAVPEDVPVVEVGEP